ncbi:MAG: EF-P beta-lysylation protein EpmB [Gammaproteobacteria bacterium]|jgi:L-lysine 2,3-aminomutase|nr:EF-P beta-lysylation protein EpmB [Gammaproteobacteria bacterium]MBT4494026.1 EF-P beta-lysylation protein EpmB [Gammaproteobacteria bacterium]MBT7370854.1 EF-P beta-lysylation protein EpmB [Gammaproteobacteria bacterium]
MPIITLSDSGLNKSQQREQSHGWQWYMQNAVRDITELADTLGLELEEVPTDFPLIVPRTFLERMQHGNADDPLLLQVLPRHSENLKLPGYLNDPLDEQSIADGTGLLQKYAGRVLIMVTGTCAVNCRYCFRRHFPYEDHQPDKAAWKSIIDRITADDSVREVILSGGDPLAINDRHLKVMLSTLAAIPHIRTIRFHTRLPVVIPQRICSELLDCLGNLEKNLVFVLHINHPQEIDENVANAMARLRSTGASLLNQSVLLKGINNSTDILCDLSHALFDVGVLPYYLHLLDPVAGAAQFNVTEHEGIALLDAVRRKISGYLVPTLVREVPGEEAKRPVPSASL